MKYFSTLYTNYDCNEYDYHKFQSPVNPQVITNLYNNPDLLLVQYFLLWNATLFADT